MKRLKNPRIAVIEAQNASQFEYLINDKMDELAHCSPTLSIEHGRFYRAYIQYMIETIMPETVQDRFELCGLHFTCRDCSQIEYARNKDGSIDKRAKYAYCKFRDGRTHPDMTACERFHIEILRSGKTPDGKKLPEALLLPDGKQTAPIPDKNKSITSSQKGDHS